jgi:hypothetical protein
VGVAASVPGCAVVELTPELSLDPVPAVVPVPYGVTVDVSLS